MKAKKTNNLVRGALILTFAGLISKVLSAAYRIPLQNLTGDVGFYLYQQVYPMIGIVMILSLYGFPVAVSKLTVEADVRGRRTYRYFYMPMFSVLLLLNGLLFLILFLLSPTLASWIGDPRLSVAFKVIAFAFLCIAPLALLRGIGQGQGNMKQTALSQVVEQLIRVTIIISAAWLIYRNVLPVERIAEIGSAATVISMVFAILLLLVYWKRRVHVTDDRAVAKLSLGYMMRTCLSVGMVAALVHMIILIIQFADVLTFVPEMIAFGSDALEAMTAKGIFDRGQPLIQFGVVIGSSFALALIPNIVPGKGQTAEITGAIGLSTYISAGATLGLVLLFPEVNLLLFKSVDGTGALQVLVIATLLSSFAITASAILQGIGKTQLIALCVVGTFFIKVGLNKLFMPMYGMYGASLATVCALLVLCLVIVWLVKRYLPEMNLFENVRVSVLLMASGGMAVYILLIKYLGTWLPIPSRFGLLLYVLFLVVTGGLVYLCLLLRYRAFTERQLGVLPFSGVFIALQQFLAKKE